MRPLFTAPRRWQATPRLHSCPLTGLALTEERGLSSDSPQVALVALCELSASINPDHVALKWQSLNHGACLRPLARLAWVTQILNINGITVLQRWKGPGVCGKVLLHVRMLFHVCLLVKIHFQPPFLPLLKLLVRGQQEPF